MIVSGVLSWGKEKVLLFIISLLVLFDFLRDVTEEKIKRITSKTETYSPFLLMVIVLNTVRKHFLECLETKSFLIMGTG